MKRIPKQRTLAHEKFSEIREGTFFSYDLENVRIELLSKGFAVTAAVSAPHNLKALNVHLAKNKICRIVTLPEGHNDLDQWVKKV